MKYNKIFMLVLILFATTLGINNIYANSYTLTHANAPDITYEGVSVYNKKLGNNTAYCISGVDVSVADSGTTCSINNNLTNEQRVMIGSIINYECVSSDSNVCYLVRELAIAKYLGKKTYSVTNSPSDYLTEQISIYEGNATASSNKSIYEASNFAISFSSGGSAVQNLTFTREGDYYKSQSISIPTNTLSYINGSVSKQVSGVNGAVIETSGTSFYVKVPVANVTKTTTITLTASANQQEYYIADLYSCGGSTQDLALSKTEKRSATKTISGTIVPKGKIIINKYDSNNRPLSGATILVTGANGFNQRYTTNGQAIVIDDLEYGKYSIDEEIAPSGYLKAAIQTVTLSENNLNATINLVDDSIKVSVLKIDENGKPLSGVKLKLLDKDSKALDICKDSNGSKIPCEWTTTKTSYDIYNLPAGTYYIKEISVPKGYNINPNKIKVEISATGAVKVDGKKADNALIKILNDLTRTEISKISAVNGEELPGATLQILDKDGKNIACNIINKEGKTETLKECKWVSGEEPTIVLGLPSGKYFLEETIAPEGYELNKNKVEFEIKADGSVTKVEMKNNLMVKVPDTLSSRSALLIAISMFDIALGIGIITYVKKNKVEE